MSDVPRRRRVAVAGAAAVLAALLVSPALGRAPVRYDYREPAQADGLTTGCRPLPGGVRLDVVYVLRRDGETLTAEGVRRLVLIHVDQLDWAEAAARVERQFAKAGVGDVTVTGGDFDVPDDDLVQSWLRLDLPPTVPTAAAIARPVCGADYVTKRFLPDLPDATR